MTEAERYRSTLYTEFDAGHTILDALLSVERTSDWVEPERPIKWSAMLQVMVCEADFLFLGTVTQARSLPTSTGRFLFTDHSVRVDKTFRARLGVRPMSPIVVSRPGGHMSVEGVQVEAKASDYPELRPNTQYYFFTHSLGRDNAFSSPEPRGTFATDGDFVTALGPPLFARDLRDPAKWRRTEFELDLATATRSCK
jgi:hypothetical protein